MEKPTGSRQVNSPDSGGMTGKGKRRNQEPGFPAKSAGTQKTRKPGIYKTKLSQSSRAGLTSGAPRKSISGPESPRRASTGVRKADRDARKQMTGKGKRRNQEPGSSPAST
jgi:hypothetical protein